MADEKSPELPPPVVDARKSPRKRVLLGAKLVYHEGKYSIDARVRDMSDGGARVVLPPGQIIPTRVVLVDTRNRVAYESEVAWLKPPEFGLKFLATYSLRDELPPGLKFLKGMA